MTDDDVKTDSYRNALRQLSGEQGVPIPADFDEWDEHRLLCFQGAFLPNGRTYDTLDAAHRSVCIRLDESWARRVLASIVVNGGREDPGVLVHEADVLISAIRGFEDFLAEQYGCGGSSFVAAAIARYFGADYVLGAEDGDGCGPDPAGEIVQFARLDRAAMEPKAAG
jgi:hypothetical protein